MYLYMVLFSCGDYHNILLNEMTLLMEKKKKVSKILLSVVLTTLLAFSVSAAVDGPTDPMISGSASASSSSASASISINTHFFPDSLVEASAAIGNTFGWAHDDHSSSSSTSASVSDSELERLSEAPVQASRAYSYLDGDIQFEDYWPN